MANSLQYIIVACEQALRSALRRGGKMKESLQLRLWNLNICIENVDVKCCLAKMTKVMTSLLLARVFQWLLTFALVSASRWLADIFKQLSPRWTTGELTVGFKFQRRSCKLSFVFTPRRQSAPESSLAGKRYYWDRRIRERISSSWCPRRQSRSSPHSNSIWKFKVNIFVKNV